MANKAINNVNKVQFKLTRQCFESLKHLKQISDLHLIQTQHVLVSMLETIDTGAGYALGKNSITKSQIKKVIHDAQYLKKRDSIMMQDFDGDFRARRSFEDAIKNSPAQICDEGVADVFINDIEIPVSKYVLEAFEYADELRCQNDPLHGIDTYFLLVAFTHNEDCNAFSILNKLMLQHNQLSSDGLRTHFSSLFGFRHDRRDGKMENQLADDESKNNRMHNKLNNPDYSLLEDIATDLTALARNGELPKVIGRNDELKQIELVLARKNKNNIALIGPGGVGKSAIAEGLALKIVNNEIPSLKNKRMLQFSMMDLISKAGEFVQKSDVVLRFIQEIKRERDVILFIDEIHMIGSHKSFTDVLKPLMARGDFRIIGATTPEEWRVYIAKDSALVRRFEIVDIDEPDFESTFEIVKGAIHSYERYHQVKISDDIIERSIHLAHKYLEREKMPDSVFTLIDNASALCKLQHGLQSEIETQYFDNYNTLKASLEDAKQIEFNESAINAIREQIDVLQSEYNRQRNQDTDMAYQAEVTIDHLKEAIEYKSVNTVREIDMLDKKAREQMLFNNLKSLTHKMKNQVIGQSEAVEAVSQAVIRNITGFRDKTKPAGVFLFLGTTGVGKTETAKVLAEILYGDDDGFVRFDMSEYQAAHEVSKLIGAPPGYAGYGQGGLLTNAVMKHPKAVILFDEVEKAHQKVFDILLQVFDDGRLTDGNGKIVDFTETIIILTSNLGASDIRTEKPVGFGAVQLSELDFKTVQSKSLAAAQSFFRPEFLNRIEEIITFKPFSNKEIFAITKLLVEKEIKMIESMGFTAHFDDTAIQYIADSFYDPINGARPIKRGITKVIQNKLAELLINGQLQKDEYIHVVSDGKDVQLEIMK